MQGVWTGARRPTPPWPAARDVDVASSPWERGAGSLVPPDGLSVRHPHFCLESAESPARHRLRPRSLRRHVGVAAGAGAWRLVDSAAGPNSVTGEQPSGGRPSREVPEAPSGCGRRVDARVPGCLLGPPSSPDRTLGLAAPHLTAPPGRLPR